jgi:hypothetical protein
MAGGKIMKHGFVGLWIVSVMLPINSRTIEGPTSFLVRLIWLSSIGAVLPEQLCVQVSFG